MDMDSLIKSVCTVVQALESLTGITLNAFIIGVISLGFRKGRDVGNIDKILFALSLSSAAYAFTFLAFLFLTSYNSTGGTIFLGYFVTFSVTSCSWLTACLCVFYFIKIIQFTSGFLSWVKRKINAIVPWMIMVAEGVSLSCVLVHKEFQGQLSFMNSSAQLSAASGTSSTSLMFLVTNCLAFLIVTVTTLCTVGYLRLHIHRIKKGTSGSPQSHQNAAKTMIRLFILYLIFYFVFMTFYFQVAPPNSWWFQVNVMLGISFSSVQSVLLITASSRLSTAWLQLHRALRCLKTL
ncbi:taste receptor type 2 member 40-like [Spea bombifrons]|uniref:taste receptor type 2 member 40-like n=1 Tax=Spea bombifrons TaxID=233779 RepID=UPI00234ABF6F|nr:taste receptor type 2 member 40-like [Spea bombifrons]